LSNNHDQVNANESKRITNNSLDLDSLDIKIMRELLGNPNSSSSKMVRKFGIPFSTVQRRKTRLERLVLTRKYELNTHDLGWRNAEILMLVENGKADYMAEKLIEKFDKIIGTSTRINTNSNLAAYVSFRNSYELHELMEKIRAMPNVSNIEWSEIVRDAGNKTHRLAHLIFDPSE
jgi:DNA-binding Lrp family transcriptional regulator